MSEDDKAKLVEAVNASGFPLQLRLHHEVHRRPSVGLRSDDRWTVLSSEFPWRDEPSGRGGFVDLVVFRDPLCFVVECKRRGGGPWTFLVSPRQRSRRHVRCVVADHHTVLARDIGHFDPASPESEYCAVPGAGAQNRRSLERIASELVLATDSIADQYNRRARGAKPIAFVPAIVCVPAPTILGVDPETVSLEDGTVPAGEVECARLIRFRKTLSQREVLLAPTGDITMLEDSAAERERTVFVVHAPAFGGFLDELWHRDELEPTVGE